MKLVTKTLAGLALAASFAAPALAGVCSSQTTLTGLGPPGTASFGQSFAFGGNKSDCYTFSLGGGANSTGTTTEFDLTLIGGINVTNISLFSGGVSGNSTQGAALYSDNSPSAFAFTTVGAGLFTLQVLSQVSGLPLGLVGYNGTITTKATTAAVPEPASLALLGLGLLGLGFARRKVTS